MNIFIISKQLINKVQIKSPGVLGASPGFLLIELMIAVIITVIFTYCIYCYYGMIIETNYEAIKRYEVTNLIQSFLAQATFDRKLLQQKSYCHNNITLTWNFQNFSYSQLSFTKKLLSKVQYVTVQAEWIGLNKKKHIMFLTSGIEI